MSNTRLKDVYWCPGDENNTAPNWERVQVAILMDIRDRLDVLRCSSFIGIPSRLFAIEGQLKSLRRERRRKKQTDATRRKR